MTILPTISFDGWKYQSADPEFPKVGLLISFDGASSSTTFTDESLLENTLTPLGGASISAAPRFGSGNLVTTGTQTLKLTNRCEFAMDDFTIECWVKPGTQLDGGYNTVIGSYSNNFTQTGDWSLRTRIAGSNQLSWTVRNETDWTDIATGVNLNDGIWHHIAITREADTLRIYSDGILRGTATSATRLNDAYDIVIGGNNNTYEFEKNYVGAIDELRITRNLARYTGSTYTVPTGPFDGQQAENVDYQTNFEDPNKTSFAAATVNINGRNWVLDDAVIASNQSGDLKNGAKSLRLRNGSVTLSDAFADGIASFRFLAARSNFTGDRTGVSPTVAVQYTTDNGTTWITAGTINFAGIDALTEFSYTINTTTSTRLRLIKTAGDAGKRVNFDDLIVYKCPGCTGSELVCQVKDPEPCLDPCEGGYIWGPNTTWSQQTPANPVFDEITGQLLCGPVPDIYFGGLFAPVLIPTEYYPLYPAWEAETYTRGSWIYPYDGNNYGIIFESDITSSGGSASFSRPHPIRKAANTSRYIGIQVYLLFPCSVHMPQWELTIQLPNASPVKVIIPEPLLTEDPCEFSNHIEVRGGVLIPCPFPSSNDPLPSEYDTYLPADNTVNQDENEGYVYPPLSDYGSISLSWTGIPGAVAGETFFGISMGLFGYSA